MADVDRAGGAWRIFLSRLAAQLAHFRFKQLGAGLCGRHGRPRHKFDLRPEPARQAQAKRLYLETNSGLAPAIALYESVGFIHLPARPTPDARADVFMEKRL